MVCGRRICASTSDWLHANTRINARSVRCCDSKEAAYLSVVCSNTSTFTMCGYDTRPRYAWTFLHHALQPELRVACVDIAFFASHVFIYFSKCFRSILVRNFSLALVPSFVCRAKHIYIVLFLRADEIVKVSFFFFFWLMPCRYSRVCFSFIKILLQKWTLPPPRQSDVPLVLHSFRLLHWSQSEQIITLFVCKFSMIVQN